MLIITIIINFQTVTVGRMKCAKHIPKINMVCDISNSGNKQEWKNENARTYLILKY